VARALAGTLVAAHLVVVLDDPQRPAVYLEAATI